MGLLALQIRKVIKFGTIKLKNLFMTDANGKYSDKLSLKLRDENGKTYVDVVADQAFLQDKDTKYPVTKAAL
jgi:hypothetical protein